ncbi:hypothetical protein G9A89_001379 [Geosiphon pyriformis]|nr:hypothetical protein G9A89_001379 [Geosiphon pyriformis]
MPFKVDFLGIFKIITAIFMASVFYFLMHENHSSWIASKIIQKDKKLDIKYTSPAMINWINQIDIPLKINQIKKRSQSLPKSRILPNNEELMVSSQVAFMINAIDCLGLNNLGSKKLTKEQWASRNSKQVPLRLKNFPNFDEKILVDSQLLKDVELLFPILFEAIKTSLIQIPRVTKWYDIMFTGHGLGGAYASIAGFLWAIGSFLIKRENIWPDVNLSEIGQGIFTYGAPRIGNEHLRNFFNQGINHRRFTHGNDHVPHFPSSSKGWKHFGTEIWIEPLSNCDCAADDDPNTYWDCNSSPLMSSQREEWLNSQYSDENMECNAGQSITEVPGTLFHNGPYFGVEMGNCESITLFAAKSFMVERSISDKRDQKQQ